MSFIRRLLSKTEKSSKKIIIEKNHPDQGQPRLGFSNAPLEWRSYRENYYKKWFGSSEGNLVWHEVLPVIPHIDVHCFAPSIELSRNYFTLITSGMSDEKMVIPEDLDEQYSRVEIIFYISCDENKLMETEKPWYVQSLSFLAHFPFVYKTWLAYSHTIPNGNPAAPIIEGSSLTTAFFLPAIFKPKELTRDFNLDDQKVNLLWLTYLTDKETEFELK